MKYKSFTQTLCSIYLAELFIVYPLFQKDHYYNMGNNKYMFYLILTITFLVLVFFSIISNANLPKSSNNKKKNKNKGKNEATEVVDEQEAYKNFLLKINSWHGLVLRLL